MTIISALGLGAMGLPMATNLAKNEAFTVRGFDPLEACRTRAEAAGIETFASAREAATGADVVLVAVRDQQQLNAVLHGEDGVVAVLEPGAAIILTSTVGVAVAETAGAELAAAQLDLVDAPISGGPARAGEGDLLVVVGATDAAWEKTRPVLEQMAGNLVRVGDTPGKGQAMKTVNQLLCGVHIAAAGEALALARKLGLDTEQALEALMSGAAASFMLGDRGARMLRVYDEDVEVKSRLDIFVKDMGIVTDAAKSVGLAVPVAAAAQQEYLIGSAQGLAAHDDSNVIRVVAPEA
ncbi:3-hydroxyisobutyrate dehydrogenase [Actinobaculum suis]|uniref:2-hydroxy-3-oxopropionate reductase n=1 Tax=Actinobaculum suis TaxID=1657 RepID=A0A0K9EUM2_9ACTO|nr:NAD(P)-dependent oxidoreductase [Actinobaculum suis]KMY23904.1 oxidoreductase [Actinobaculum suis]MDY5152853.1 NAD(P)-dependent oxidoreductase [Actinobaculum suis]OCA93900.1 oxidoreductase [Actinobaculum suis]OCA94831.1 oxidoreductase [Actinobaculum suis]SDE66306.1 3-hydroxyisobutyrate dehydrogenase [Actinobaculum suis]